MVTVPKTGVDSEKMSQFRGKKEFSILKFRVLFNPEVTDQY